MIKFTYPQVNKVVASIVSDPTVRRATLYVDTKTTIKATRLRPPRKNGRNESIVLTYGQPNYVERWFIKDALAAKEPFPVKKVQLTRWKKGRKIKSSVTEIAKKAQAGRRLTRKETRSLAAAAL